MGDSTYRSIEDSRHVSYDFFHIRQPVTLIFETDEKTVRIKGYVQENQPGIFSENEETQIDIVCPDPWFYELDSTETIMSGIEPMFEFPFSNESLTQHLLIMGEYMENLVKTFYYRGDVAVGFIAEVEFEGAVRGFKLSNVDKRETIVINDEDVWDILGLKGDKRKYEYGDKIVISTVPGAKGAWLDRGGMDTDIMNAVARYSDWPMIYPGENTFAYEAIENVEKVFLKLTYDVAYEGL